VQLLVCLVLVCTDIATLLPSRGPLASAAAVAPVTPPDAPIFPEPPRVYLDTTYVLPAGGTTFTPGTGPELQVVINAAQPGDVIVLTAGVTYTGNFTLPNQSGSGWIYIVSSALASLPAPGTRVTPAVAAFMPKIVTSNLMPAILTAQGAHHYRFVGIEITTTWASTSGSNFGLVQIDTSSPSSVDQLPHHFTFDRCYIHGTVSGNVRRGIAMNSGATAVVDSYFEDFHEVSADSQAIVSWNGTGPFKIVNNYLSAAGENVMFGGASPSIFGLVPSDIEIRGNHIRKSLTWKLNDPSYAGRFWSIKNLLELKNAQRVVVQGNVLEQNWASGQPGFAILLTPRNEDGSAPWSVVQDVAFLQNIVRHSGAGFSVLGSDYQFSSQRTARVLVRDNLFYDLKESWGPGWALGVFLAASSGPGIGAADLTVDHNTMLAEVASMFVDADGNRTPQEHFVFQNNIAKPDVLGSGTGNSVNTLNAYFNAPVFSVNALVAFASPQLPGYPGNFFPATIGAVGFVDVAAGDYTLGPGSPFKNAGTDGRDLGADIGALNAAVSCALTAICSTTAPLIGGVQASGITFSSATINWATNQVADSQVEYGLTTAYGSATAVDPTLSLTHGQSLAGLTAGTTYHYRVLSRNSAGLTVSGDVTFTTVFPPPVISGIVVSAISTASATIGWTTDQAADSQIEYGVTTSYGSTTILDAALLTTHSQALAGLAPGTTYHYRLRSRNSDGVLGTSANGTFATQPIPIISGLTISNIQGQSAAVNWQTDHAADTQVEYGLTTAYGILSVLNPTLSTGHGQAISAGLVPGTLYHLRARSRNALGHLGISGDVTFTTAPAPVITAVGTSAVTATSAVVSWTTDLPSKTQVEYGLTLSYGSATPLDNTLVTLHSQTISGLTPGTTYFFLVRSTTAQNALAKLGGFSFTTLAPPVITNVTASGLTSTGATIAWTTNHGASSQVEFGLTTAYGSSTTLDPALLTAHSQALTGLTTQTTYHYRVKSQSAGGSTTSADFTFTTPEPPPVISNVASSAVTTSTANITWTTDRPSGSMVEYGTTTAYGSQTTVPGYVTSHSVLLTGLTPGATYHYRVQSGAAGGTSVSGDFTFVTLDPPPAISNVLASAITTTSATIGWTTDRTSDSQVEYGLTSAYGNATTLDPSLATAHSQTLTGLTPGTIYHYRVRSATNGGATLSADATFATLDPAPIITNVSASAIGQTSATIGWTTDRGSDSQVEYGPTTAYGSVTALDAALVTTHTQTLIGLTPGTIYHYRVKSKTNGGMTVSEDFTFTTLEPPPVLSSILASAITTTSALIGWTTDRASDSQVEYGLTTAYGSATSLDAALVTSHAQALAGLTPGTIYHYRVKSRTNGGLSVSGDLTFTTVFDPPVVSGIVVSGVSGGTATIGWTTDQPADSQVEYGLTTAYGGTTALDATLVTSHSQAIAGLTSATTYHFRVLSRNAAGQLSTSADGTFTTAATPVVTNVVISNIQGATVAVNWQTDQPTDTQIEYGITTNYGSTTTLNPTLMLGHGQALSGLQPGTTYQIRIRARNAGGVLGLSGNFTFTTAPAPVITNVAASNVTGTSALITWTTDLPSKTQIEYGLTLSYGSATALDHTLVTSHSQTISGLTPGTTYFFLVRSTTAQNALAKLGGFSFTTLTPPVISNVTASAVTASSATIGWTTSHAADSLVEYGPTTAYGFTSTLDPALVTSHSQVLTGLTPETTYHYRVKSQHGGGSATSGDFTFTTLEPLPVISNVTASNVTATTATITWTTDRPAHTAVQYGLTTAYGISDVVTGMVTDHTSSLTGLTPGTTYHYRVQSLAGGGTAFSADATFTTLQLPPVISNVLASGVTTDAATISWTTDRASDSQVEYGLTTAYGSTTGLDVTPLTAHAQALAGLTPGTTYHYRVRSATNGGVTLSGDATFTTAMLPPVITNVSATGVTTSSATIAWTTDHASDSQVEYGGTSAYGNLSPLDSALVTAHAQGLTGLAPATTFHYRVRSAGPGGLTVSGDFTFTTLPPPPQLSAIQAVSIATNSTEIHWNTDFVSDSQVEYGLTTAYGNTTALDVALVTSHSQTLSGLVPGTTYHYRVKSQTAGGLSVSADQTFTTQQVPPVISAIAVSGVTSSSATINWTTDQAADSQVEYGLTTAYGSVTTLDPALVTSHGQQLTGLATGATYHYRVLSRNAGNILAISADGTFTTSAAPVVTNVVISNIQGATAAVNWQTDQPADTQIEYGLTTAYGSMTPLNPTLMLGHGQAISGLQPGTTYNMRIRARNTGGVLGVSGNFTFTTAPAPVITNVATSNLTGTSVLVTWTTDLPSKTQIEYGLTLSYGSATPLDNTLVTLHSQTVSGLTPGTTYFFLVRSTTAQNALAKLGGFSFTTMLPPAISGVGSSAVTGTSATINWTTNQPADSRIEYGPTTAYGSTTAVDPALVTTHVQQLTGLTAGTTYHFRVKSQNGGGLTTSGDFTLTTLDPPPIISNLSASALTVSSATIGWTTDRASDSQVEYGLTTAYGSTTALDPALVTTHAQQLTGLAPSTTYHYRVRSQHSGGLTISGDATFTTLDPPPAISNVQSSAITTSSATVTWSTDLMSDSQIEFGLTTAYGSTTTVAPALVTSHSHGLTGLAPGTTYHYRVRSRNSGGVLGVSGNATLTTVALPVITNVVISNIQGATAAVTWHTDQPTDTQIEFGLTTNYGSMTTLNPALVLDHGQAITGMQPGTTYQMRIRARNSVGGLGLSGNFTFTTAPAPVITNVATTNLTPTSVVVTWTTDLPSNSRIEYGLTLSYGQITALDPALVTSHSHTISGLTPGTTYFFLVRSITGQNALAKLGGFSFTTPPLPGPEPPQ